MIVNSLSFLLLSFQGVDIPCFSFYKKSVKVSFTKCHSKDFFIP